MDEYKDWLEQNNPSREEWMQFPRELYNSDDIYSALKKAVIVDSLIHTEHFNRIFSETNLKTEYGKLRIALKKSPYIRPKSVDIDFLEPQSSQSEYNQWAEKRLLDESDIKLVDEYIVYMRIVSMKILRQYLKLEGLKPMLIVFRFCVTARDLGLQSHPFYRKIIDMLEDLRGRVAIHNRANEEANKSHRWIELQSDEF